MKLSIIIPVYNLESYISHCLDTVLNQKVSSDSFEVIAVDDGSTDNSATILDEYSQKFLNLHVYHKSNGGVSSARNLALDNAKGDYIWFVDGDDLVAENVLEGIYNDLINNNNPDLLCVKAVGFTDGEEMKKDFSLRKLNDTEKYNDWLPTWFIKRSIIEKMSLRFDENVSYGEDDLFCVFLNRKIETTVRTDKIIYYYRQRDGSALHSDINDKNIESFLKTFQANLDYANKYEYLKYKSDIVYEQMPYIMTFIASKTRSKRKQYMKSLKEYKLYPLKYIKQQTSTRVSMAKRIRQISYTRIGWLLLQIYLSYRKFLQRIKGE